MYVYTCAEPNDEAGCRVRVEQGYLKEEFIVVKIKTDGIQLLA